MEDDAKPVEDTVPKPEETTPSPEHVPPAVNTHADDDLRTVVTELKSRIDDLTETVSHVVSKAEPDTKPVRRPWTHYGSNR